MDGSPSPLSLSDTLYVYELPVTMIIQITQYIRFLNLLEVKGPYRLVLEGLRAGGI